MKHAGLIIIALVAVAAGLVVGASPAHTATTYIVNSTYGGPIPPATTPPATDFDTSDPVCETGPGNGICTLRAAIEQANAPISLGLDTIAFNIPTSDPEYDDVTKTFKIQTSSALPVISDPVIIDGRTQPQFASEVGADCTETPPAAPLRDDDRDLAINDGCPASGPAESDCTNSADDDGDLAINDGCPQVNGPDTPVIELNGLFAGSLVDGIQITAGGSGSTIRGLVIIKFGLAHDSDGIEIRGGSNNVIEGNFIGVDVNGIVTDPDGAAGNGDEFGNSGSGIHINGSNNNIIGGARPGVTCVGTTNPCNILAGGGQGESLFDDAHGVEISVGPTGQLSTGNVVKGNFIGLDIGEAESGYLCLETPPTIPVKDDDTDFAINDGCRAFDNGEFTNQCGLDVDNDGDGSPNDGCPASGPAESNCTNSADDDGDTLVNDGCPPVGPPVSETTCGISGANEHASGTRINDGCPVVIGAMKDIGNEGDGVNISGVANNTIGGTAAGEGNVITSNDNPAGGGVHIIGGPEAGSHCTEPLNPVDNDGDGRVNDGCPQVGATAETGAQCANSLNDDSADDSRFNDGCPGVRVASGNHLEGNFIGPASTGSSGPALGSSKQLQGVLIENAPDNFIGGTAATTDGGPCTGACNVISNNLTGIQIQGTAATGNHVQGSYVGLDVTGTGELGNIANGITLDGGVSNNTIGGTVAGARNVISGNDAQGLEIKGSTSAANLVQGNYIGTNAAGNAEKPNGFSGGGPTGRGVKVNGSSANTIGGSVAARNVISGNIKYGIEIVGASASGNIIQSNYIGTNPTATAPVGNQEAGMLIIDAPNTVVGGTTPALRNVISGNGQASTPTVAQGLWISGAAASGTQVQGNFIGTNVDGTSSIANLGTGLLIEGAPNNTVGGTTAAARNIISGNGVHGVEIDAAGGTGNLVRGNYIGLDVNGNVGLGNTGDGIFLSDAPANTIGGTAAGVANTVSANGQTGIHILGSGSSANFVQGNLIGTNAGGTLDRGNSQHGVFVNGAPNNIIGGTSAAARNVISGNNGTGITIQDIGATGNLVQGNRIGTNAAGSGALANTSDGVRVGGSASSNSIGGVSPGAGNTIAFNGAGVVIDSGTGNSVLSNSIHTSVSLGINLGIDGVTGNDPGDGDSGANNLQNFPVITSATSGMFNTTVAGSLNSTASTAFTLQFFWNETCDPLLHGEGANFIDSFSVTTNGSGNATFNQSMLVGGAGGKSVSATATDPGGNTSEFAQCFTAIVDLDADNDNVPDSAPDNCPLEPNGPAQAGDPERGNQTNTDGDSQGNACDLDNDNDKVYDVDENNCGGNRDNASIRPERVDGVFDNVSDDGDAQIDEPLPPGSLEFDCDGDGFKGSAENSIYSPIVGRDQDPCGTNGWPADLPGASANNALDIQDLASFVAPTRRLNTSPGNVDYSARWDLVPGSTIGDHINLTDLAALLSGPTGYPPMFAPVPPATGGRAFDQPNCPWAP